MKKGILFTIMLIIAAAFIAFIAIMQHNFMNPEFSSQELASVSGSGENPERADNRSENEMDDEPDSNPESEDGTEEEAEDQAEAEVLTYESAINVDLLNVREGPGTDHPIAGTLTLGQTVSVEDDGSEWIEIVAGEISGYINRKYIDEEEQ